MGGTETPSFPEGRGDAGFETGGVSGAIFLTGRWGAVFDFIDVRERSGCYGKNQGYDGWASV